MLTIQEIRQLQTKDLHEELAKSSRDLLRIKLDIINGHSKEHHQVKVLKRYIARLKTTEKESQKESKPNESMKPVKPIKKEPKVKVAAPKKQ